MATLDLLLKSVKTYPECFLTGENTLKPDKYCKLSCQLYFLKSIYRDVSLSLKDYPDKVTWINKLQMIP